MSYAAHTPDDDTSFRASLLKQGGGAIAVVAVSALVFWSIGVLGGAPMTPSVDQGIAAPDDGDEPDEDTDEPDDTDEPEPEPEPEEPEPEEPDEDPEPSDETDDETDDDGPDDAEADDADPAGDEADDADRTPAVDPASISVQVLDGFKADGGAAASQVAEELSSAGYRVVARNQALDYERTTVLFNPGNREAADQIAAALGGADVREQPGNLSTSVDLHVVVGADRA